MKRNRLLAAAAASLSAAALLTASAGAYMTPAAAPTENLTSSEREWSLIIPEGQTSGVEGIKKLEIVITLAGDAEQYERELAAGVYESDGETPFVDFTGHIGIGAKLQVNGAEENWYDFGYTGFVTSEKEKMAAVEPLGGNAYLFTCDLGDVDLLQTDRDVQFTFKDWGNTCEAYSLTVEEFFASYADGTVAVYADADGNTALEGHEALDRTKYAPTEEAPAETTAAETTTAAPETAAEETTPAAAETTEAAAEVTAAAANNNAPAADSGTVQTASADFGSRDTSLIIVGIAAGVVIIAVIVVMVILMLKKKQ